MLHNTFRLLTEKKKNRVWCHTSDFREHEFQNTFGCFILFGLNHIYSLLHAMQLSNPLNHKVQYVRGIRSITVHNLTTLQKLVLFKKLQFWGKSLNMTVPFSYDGTFLMICAINLTIFPERYNNDRVIQ